MEGIHHVSLSITDIHEARQFYSTILGLAEIERPDFGFPGIWYQVGEQQLHLTVHPASDTLRPKSVVETKAGHFAIRVKDYDQTLHYLKQSGVQLVEKPESKSGFAQIFCLDPDNNVIELNVDQADLQRCSRVCRDLYKDEKKLANEVLG
ncbi:VOC family protein [Halalkalibacter oceani]|nr:VOC family protein [Halalkalibacter oceani]